MHDALKIFNILFAMFIIMNEIRACIKQRKLIKQTIPIIVWLVCQSAFYIATFVIKMDKVTANAFGSGLRLQGLLVLLFIRLHIYRR